MLVIDGTFGQMIGNNIHHLNNERMFNLLTNNGLYTRLGMSVITQGGSGRQYVTGPGRTISKYRLVIECISFSGDLRHNKPQLSYFVFVYSSKTLI